MADIVVTAAKVSPVYPTKAEIYPFIAGVTITAGQVVYLATDGKVGVGEADQAAKDQPLGIALQGVGAWQAVDVLIRGHVYGFTLANQNYGIPLYLSDTAGAMTDTAGESTVNQIMARVFPLSDSSLTKVVFIDIPFATEYA